MDTVFAPGTAPAVRSTKLSPSIAREHRCGARNYDPLPVVLKHADGCWVWDEHGLDVTPGVFDTTDSKT